MAKFDRFIMKFINSAFWPTRLNWLMLLAVFVASPLMHDRMAHGQQIRCQCCENPKLNQSPTQQRYWKLLQKRVDRTVAQGQQDNPMGQLGPANSAQVVFLDFDSGVDGDLDYTTDRRDEIQVDLERIYARFDVCFTQQMPTGQFSTIVFNEGGFGSGLAEDVDFRNLNKSDNAILNLDGVGLSDSQIAPASSAIAAHELGHLLGLRHEDIFGPIGSGINAGFGQLLNPVYTGPEDAFDEAQDHVMVTGTFGIPFSSVIQPSWLSERSAVKLTLAESIDTVIDVEGNDSIEAAQPILLPVRNVPNTIVEGQNAGTGDFFAGVVVVEGRLDGVDDGQDYFRIEGRAGDILNLAVLSNVPDRLEVDPIDPNISVFDSLGNFVDYYGSDAFNEDEFKSLDSNMFDLLLPADGQYFIKVDSKLDSDSGVYELLVYRFDGNGRIGDINCDGAVDLLDISPFVAAIIAGEFSAKADINSDGFVNLGDIGPFVDLFTRQ